jgi:Mn2+/Fe2+ NRAMP family transporter
MSYQPEPERHPRRLPYARQYLRLAQWTERHPVAFLFRAWLFFAACVVLVFLVEGFEGFEKPSGRLGLAVAVLGWILPFVMWVRKRKLEQKK